MRTDVLRHVPLLWGLIACQAKPEPTADDSPHSGGADSIETAAPDSNETAAESDSVDSPGESADTDSDSEETAASDPAHWTTLSVGWRGVCALASNGKGACWGHDEAGELAIPDEEFLALEVGSGYTCGIRLDETITCWGLEGRSEYDFGQLMVPEGRYRQVAAAMDQVCAIDESEELVCWGRTFVPYGYVTPEGTFSAISGGEYVNCGVTTAGGVECWIMGQTFEDFFAPDYVAVAAGRTHALALRANGEVDCRGGLVSPETCGVPEGVLFRSIAAGQEASCGVTLEGSLVCWAASGFHKRYISVQEDAPTEGTWKHVDVGDGVACALSEADEISCWGVGTAWGYDEIPDPPE